MTMRIAIILLLLFASPVAAQDEAASSAAENPLTALNDELKRVLAGANLPFTTEQEQAVVLMVEERRRASEDLFGALMNFQSGPTSGQEADRLRSAIEWMRNEFNSRIQGHLTPEQLAVWSRFQASTGRASSGAVDGARGRRPPAQTQYVRINNNAFTAEDLQYRFQGFGGPGGGGGGFPGGGGPGFQGGGRQGGGGRGGGQGETEVIQRGGAGAYHGNSQFLLKDDALNARNSFAGNKPPYQERQFSFDVSGPVVPGRLTSSIAGSHNRAENVDTVRATLPDGVFALGITKPTVNRALSSQNTFQATDAHSLGINVRYFTQASKRQNTGGFNLPERASNNTFSFWNVELRQFSSLSSQSIYESRFALNGNHSATTPLTDSVRINVLDAFSSGGAQNTSDDRSRTYDFSNLYTRLGEKLTIKTGMEGTYRDERSLSTGNFGGTYTFSNLDAYLAGAPLNYRVNRGAPFLRTTQLELSFFMQDDLKLTPQLTLMFGGRYDLQTNLTDRNNLSPRLGVAYAIGPATVIRGGGGIFYNRLGSNLVETQNRQNGTHQFEIVIDNPSYPEPFQAGSIRQTPPSVRVTDPRLAATSNTVGMISFERTLPRNLFVTATYEIQRGHNRYRLRNLNAPFDLGAPVLRACRQGQSAETCVRPNPNRGNVLNLESTGREDRQNARVTVRQRFSIFNVSANYVFARVFQDGMPGGNEVATDSYDLRADWGRAPFSAHSVNGTVNAQMPLGIFLTGTMQANSPRFYNITTGNDDNRDTYTSDRPVGVARNSAEGPRYLNFNFNVSKAFFFGGSAGGGNSGARMNMNLFANMTNAFNRVHYGNPSGVMTSPNFGRSTSATEPREIEIGLRFQF